MTVNQTRCPFCHSAFYITSLQLNAYRGQARCGQCHQIFDATGNMTGNSPAPVPDQAVLDDKPVVAAPTEDNIQDAPLNTPSASIQNASAEKELLFSDDVGLEDNAVQDKIKSNPQAKTENNTPESTVENSQTVTTSQNISAKAALSTMASVSEDDALMFSDEIGFPDEEADINKQTTSSGIVLDGTFDQNFLNDTFDELDVLGKHELSGVEKLNKAADDSWLEDLLAEEDVPEIEEEVKTDPNLNNRAVNINSIAAQAQIAEALAQRAAPDHDEDLLSFLNRTGAVTMPSTQTEKPAYSSNARPASNRILKPTPVETNPAYFVGWSLMSLLMVGLLIGQYIYFNFEEMSMNPKTSAYISKGCALFGCQIPYMNADEIQIKNIRLIGNKKLGQTTFKAQITNSAKLSQPFPALRLTFQENGQTVASQIIQPRQYLPDELKTLARLASKNPYPIQFTVKTKRNDIEDFKLEAQYQ